jgi:hypothetical protein
VNVSGPSARGLWSLLWRSVVLLPVAVAFLCLLYSAWVGVVCLPVAAAISILDSKWWPAAAYVALWFPSWFFVRWHGKWERSDAFDHRGDI